MSHLKISIGQFSDKGVKPINQDFHTVFTPKDPLLNSKGIVIALADGISSSEVSQYASEISVKGFVEDYYSTSEAWSVKKSAQRVLHASNSWLYAKTRNGPFRYDIDKGYVCTFSTIILKSATAYIFNVGDTRIYRVFKNDLEQLTEDHRLWVSRDKSYLSRALGMRNHLDIDYQTHAIVVGDIFLLSTDGVYEYIDEEFVIDTIIKNIKNLDEAAQKIVEEALSRGSDDNLTVQVIRIDEVPECEINELHQQATALPYPPSLRPRMIFEDYEILREIHMSSRSHVYLARDTISDNKIILKLPSTDMSNDPAYLERFLMEEWVAHRVENAHLLKPCSQKRKKNYLYTVTEYIEGQTLLQWMADNPRPELETVRNIIEQIARGLQALHRQEMLHQDIRPNNIMIDKSGTVKIIDFGSVKVAGLDEIDTLQEQQHILGTMQYTAPEYFLGKSGTSVSDLYSLGVITYHMLSGRFPYGTNVAKATTRSDQLRLVYQTVLDAELSIPEWIDGAISKAVHINPEKRYNELSEFVQDLRHPNPAFLSKERAPLLERNPILFWKSFSILLLIMVLLLIITHPVLNH